MSDMSNSPARSASTTTLPTVASAVVERLARANVRRVYTVPGESFLGLLDGVQHHAEMQLVSTRHESGAAFAAVADSMLSGTPGVVLATRAVGAANLAIGIHAARQDSVPIVAILGQVESPHIDKEALQETDLSTLYRPITKWATTAHVASRVPDLVDYGLRVALNGRPGPVMIAVPSDFFDTCFTENPPSAGSWGYQGSLPRPQKADLEKLARQVGNAQRPVFIAGGGVRHAREPLVDVVERLNVAVYTAFRRQDAFPNRHPLYVGNLGTAPLPATLETLKAADLVVAIGTRLDQVTTQDYKLPTRAAQVVHIDLEPETFGRSLPSVHGIAGDSASALQILSECAPSHPRQREWQSAHQAWLESSEPPPAVGTEAMSSAQVVHELREVAPENTVVTIDAGNFSSFVHAQWIYDHPITQAGTKSGAMGFAIPAAIGAKLAVGTRTVVATVGDGGFLMTGTEIETAVRLRLPVVIVAFRNGLYGTIAMHQSHSNRTLAGTTIGEVDLAEFARSLGAAGYTAATPEQLRSALTQALASDGPTVVDAVVDPDITTPTTRLSGPIQ